MKNLITLFAVVAIAFTSCKKTEVGPAGPAGKDGTANIKVMTYTSNNSSWTLDNTDNTYSVTITDNDITADVVSKGTVQCFWGDNTGSGWIAMPFSLYDVEFNFAYGLNQVEVIIGKSDKTSFSNPGGMTFKIVVIPPAQ